MADVGAAHEQLVGHLRARAGAREAAGLSPVAVCDGDVDDDLLVDETGRVCPYVVVWSSPGARPGERSVVDVAGGGLVWPVQITVAGGEQSWVLGAVGVLREWLADLVLDDGGLLLEVPDVARPVVLDRGESPPRYYAPTQWRALLP